MVDDENKIAEAKAVLAKKEAAVAELKSEQASSDAETAIDKANTALDAAKSQAPNERALPDEMALQEAKEAIELGEHARDEAEEARSKAEIARSEAEDARGRAEQVRSKAEQKRSKAEAHHSLIEAELGKADEARRIAEESREMAERAMQNAARAQTQAQIAEERYRLVVEGSDDGLWDWDLEKGTVYWNGRFFRMLGAPESPVIPTEEALFHLVHPDDRQRLVDAVQSARKTGEHFSEAFRVRHLEGHYLHCSMRGKALLNARGQAIRLSGMIQDITDRIHAQEEVQRYSRRLEQSNKDLEQFAAVASHDLQGPLRKIKAFADYLEQDAKDTLKPESLDDLRRMQRSVNEMQRLISDLLSFSKVAKGEKMAHFEPVNLADVLARAQAELDDVIDAKKAHIEIRVSETIKGDADQLYLLFQNLLQNALKYQPKLGTPQISIASEATGDGFCHIRVKDNGIGFDPADGERIFEIFERLHSKSAYPGTGIGLAICRRIAERHGGTLTATSQPGKGSTFDLKLPL